MTDIENPKEEEEDRPAELELEEELEGEVEEEESILTEYDPDDFVSGAVTTAGSSLPSDLFEFEYAYGYNCKKYFNLCACDDSVVCWSAGSVITFMDVNTKQIWFRRSTTGGSVGNITSYRKDPNYRIAIAEGREGAREPLILLYTWPQMELDAVLRDGTTNAYSIMDFSPDGDLLASVGREPDYNLTIWNWRRHGILLRTSAFTFDVHTVFFSPYCPGQLTTAGAAHIKFWKMAETFTGLKLKGELGRFGKTEICDVLGVYPMPDEKVLSGCEWGNMLVWEAGLVKVEVTQRGRKRCHQAPIVQFMLSEAGDEVTTVARDGCARAWYWDTVDQADPPEDDPYVELNPVAETCVPDCQIMCLKHQKEMFWYAQDGNGGIWTVELEIDKVECEHRKIMTCHAGAIVAMAALRNHPILITAGEDGALQAYNTETHMLLVRYVFPAPITCILYPTIDVDETSRLLVVGFADGVMRTLLLHPNRMEKQMEMIEVRIHSALTVHSDDSIHAYVIDLISLLKPHSKAITQIAINDKRTRLVTSGEDSTIFIYKLRKGTPFTLNRIGFIETPTNIAFMTWKPNEEKVLLLCGEGGLLMEAVLPNTQVRNYSDITTFKLEFKSYKEALVKKYFMRHRPFPEEEDLASLDEEALKTQEEMVNDDEDEEWLGEVELVESEHEAATTITWAGYCPDGSVWVIQRGTGALLLVKPGNPKVLKYAPIPGAWSEDISVLKFVCENKYLVLGTNTGYIRVVRMPTDDEDNPDHHHKIWTDSVQKLMKKLKGRRLAKEEVQPTPRIDFTDTYYLPMHDRYTGYITGLEFSPDLKKLFTCGKDGNIFSFKINFEEPLLPIPELRFPREVVIAKIPEPSTVDGVLMSHEQLKQKEEYDEMMARANAHKKLVREQLNDLTTEYNKLIKLNRALPASQQIDVTLDPRPLAVQEQEIEEARALTERKLAHQLEASDLALHKMYSRNIVQLDVFPFTLRAIRDPNVVIRPLRQKNLSQQFYDQLEEVYQKMADAALKGRRTESLVRRGVARRMSWGQPRLASFLLGLPPRPPHPLKKALRNYHQRLDRHHAQFVEWQEHLSLKPDPNAMPPGAAEALKEAEATIGNRLLKTQDDYVAPPGHNTQLRICLARKEIYDTKRAFNEKVLELRGHKVNLMTKIKQIGERLSEIRVEIPPNMVKQPPAVPQIDEDLEFPERNLEVKIDIVTSSTPRVTMTKRNTERRTTSNQIINQMVPRIKAPRVPRFVPLMETKPLAATWELLKPKQDYEFSPVEIEIRERRIERHLYEQDMLIADAEISVREFDSRLRQLQRERVRVQEKNQLLELHLYQLHQEMNVLNRFEAHEDRLAERVYVKLMQIRGVQDQLNECSHRVEEHRAERERLELSCQELQRQFKKMVQDNKFADFLRRIFKRRYRPPRDADDDESESESSESSSEEEDEGSLDSRDIGPIRLDPNICPEGCDQEIYDQTYEMRNTRHKHEQEILEQDRLVELLKKDIDAHNKVKDSLTVQLDKRKNELREFMMEKQSRMNEVSQVVVLRYDQIRARAIQHVATDGLRNAVVFPERLLTRLRRRVLELQDEIKQQRLRQKINRTHLHRMNIDIRAMESEADELREKMRDVLTKKLGKPRKVDRTLDDLLKQMARRHKFTATMDFVPLMMQQIRDWRERYSELEKKYYKNLKHYSERLRLAAALQSDVLPQKQVSERSSMAGGYTWEEYERDVVRLRIVHSQQLHQIQALNEEIHGLRVKPLVADVTDAMTSRRPSVRAPSPPDRPTELELVTVHRNIYRAKKYFPIAPGKSSVIQDVDIMVLLYDCLDAMKLSRDDASQLLKDLTDKLPLVLSGEQSRYQVVDELVKSWLLKYGGDPAQYKRQTRAFDALAALSEKLLSDHAKAMEGPRSMDPKTADALETALRNVSDERQPLRERLAPAIAALMQSAGVADIETAETMSCLVNSLIDDKVPLTQAAIEDIDVKEVVQDIKALGIRASDEEIEHVVQMSIRSLEAQVLTPEEHQLIEDEVQKVLEEKQKSLTSYTSISVRSRHSRGVHIDERSVTSRSSAPVIKTKSEESFKKSSSLSAMDSKKRTVVDDASMQSGDDTTRQTRHRSDSQHSIGEISVISSAGSSRSADKSINSASSN